MKLPAARIEALVWVLIYVGMVIAGVGVAMQSSDTGLGWGMATFGALLVVAGIGLVWVRSRMHESEPRMPNSER